MAKAGTLLKKILTKSKRYNAEKHDAIIQALNDGDFEMDEEDINITVNSLLTREEAETQLADKLKAKLTDDAHKAGWAEAYDGIDKSILPEYIALLSENEKKEFDAIDSTPKKTRFLLEHYRGRSNGSKDAETYKAEYAKIKKALEDEYVPKSKYDEAMGQIGAEKAKAFRSQVGLYAKTSEKITDEAKKNRRFLDNFMADFNELLEKEKYAIDDSGKIITKGENSTFVLNEETNEPLTVEDWVSKTASSFDDYTRKSDGKKSSGSIELPTDEDANMAISPAMRRTFNAMRD